MTANRHNIALLVFFAMAIGASLLPGQSQYDQAQAGYADTDRRKDPAEYLVQSGQDPEQDEDRHPHRGDNHNPGKEVALHARPKRSIVMHGA